MTAYFVNISRLVIVTALVVACADTTRPPLEPEPGAIMAPEYDDGLFQPWNETMRLASTAVSSLLQQADSLIRQQQYHRAEGKLERVLGIAPDFAPAWSRLSWLALQMNKPERARQMASRSNSFAGEHVSLKQLNQGFIRDASLQLNDAAGAERANQAIDNMGRGR